MSLKYQCQHHPEEGYYTLEAGVDIPVRIFLSEKLYAESEEGLFQQIQTAASYPGALEVSKTPKAVVVEVPLG